MNLMLSNLSYLNIFLHIVLFFSKSFWVLGVITDQFYFSAKTEIKAEAVVAGLTGRGRSVRIRASVSMLRVRSEMGAGFVISGS